MIVDRQDGSVLLAWRLARGAPGVPLRVRPLLSGRDYHALMHENAAFAFAARDIGGNVAWHPYPALPAVTALTNGRYVHEPAWYRNFDYSEEAARGLDHIEDLGAPGTFHFDLSRRDAVVVLRAGDASGRRRGDWRPRKCSEREARAGAGCWRRSIAPPKRTSCRGDWATRSSPAIHGSPTGAATRSSPCAGCCSRAGATTSPDRSCWRGRAPCPRACCPIAFPNTASAPEFNSVDASLWFVIVVARIPRRGAPGRVSARAADGRHDRDPRRLRGGHALRHPDGR